MSTVTVSRPPSVHAPWRKSYIITLFVFNLLFTSCVCIYGFAIYGSSIYLGTDTGVSDFSEKTNLAGGAVGLLSTIIVIAHIVLFSRFRLTAQIFLYGNLVVVLVSFVQLATGIAAFVRKEEDDAIEYLTISFEAANCFFAIWMLVYAVLVWRRVNAGRERDMSRPRKWSNAGAKGLDAQQEGGIPMI
ncbi:hypothetical protein V498_07503 [Pseudogymnoascus sp. VKM F-4517 (FW-2822)]|nr:hypothetical protein V498_07503 [Pseudogymnoascus sp. VKM F-4517 (FW-2822)]